MLYISEKEVSVEHVRENDESFVNECCSQSDYKMYFDTCYLELANYRVLKHHEVNIGIVSFQEFEMFGINTVRIEIYVHRTCRVLSVFCILSSIRYAMKCFEDVERIDFYVYGNNTPCIKLFKQLGFEPECIYPSVKKNNDFYDLYCYSIYPSDDLCHLRKTFESMVRR